MTNNKSQSAHGSNDWLNAYWMPFTPNKQFKAHPRMHVRAEGHYYYSADDRAILDAIAGIWCTNLGHGHPDVVAAIRSQAAELDYSPSFHFGHPKAFDLASVIADQFPDSLTNVFFTNSGSEAVDTALKMAIAYQRLRGEGSRTRLIGREQGYHGTGFGGISVGGMANNRKFFGSLLPGVDHLRLPYDPQKSAFSKGQSDADITPYVEELERLIALHDPSTIAALIIEPFSGSGGVYVPPKGYLQAVREITQRHGIVLIWDEVISAFGRLGAANASTLFGIEPDLVALAKGINNGAVPLGAVVASKSIFDTFMDRGGPGIEFFHGYTYSGHPLAVAAALAAQRAYTRDNLFAKAAQLAPYLEERAHSLRGEPHVADVRNIGLVAGLTLAQRSGQPGIRATEVFQKAYENGVVVRHNGDTIAFSPILTMTAADIDTMIEATRDALRNVQ
ncbi:MAG: aminotransferase class III-fold pyridoxal phosphate-dependent enzyme [Pseudomonadales bacterium]